MLSALVGAVLAALLLAGCEGERLEPADPGAWTLMVFMEGDNNLELDLLVDLLQMELVGSTDEVNVVVQFNRAREFSDADGNWSGARRYHVARNDDLVDFAAIDEQRRADPSGLSLASPVLAELGDVGSGDPGALVDFVSWTAEYFPAERYGLLLLNHGGAWAGGFGSDGSAEDGGLSLPLIDEALDGATEALGAPFDFIGFDACSMSQLEILEVLSRYGDYAAAAQELEPAPGWHYAGLLEELTADPGMDGADLAVTAVETFIEFYEQVWPQARGEPFPGPYDLAAVELASVPAVSDALEAFADLAAEQVEDVVVDVGRARNNVLEFGGLTPDALDRVSSVDLVHLLELMLADGTVEEIADAAEELIDAVDEAVLLVEGSDGLAEARGIATFFPRNAEVAEAHGLFARYGEEVPHLGAWRDFMAAYFAAAQAAPSELRAEILDVYSQQPAVSTLDPAALLLETEGQRITRVEASAALQRDAGPPKVLDEWELTSAVTDEDGVALRRHDGYELAQLTWEVDLRVLTDGDVRVPVLLQDTGNPDQRSVSGEYQFANGEVMEGSLTFEAGELVAAYGINVSAFGKQPHQIKPAAGDAFTPNRRSITEDGAVVTEPADDELVFGDEPFSLDVDPAPSGTYEFRVDVVDIAGNRATGQAEIEVDNDGVRQRWRGEHDLNLGLSFLRPWDWEPALDVELDDGGLLTELAAPDADMAVRIPHPEVLGSGEDDGPASLADMQQPLETYLTIAGYPDDLAQAPRTPVTVLDGEGWRIDYDGPEGGGVLLVAVAEDRSTGYLVDLTFTDEADAAVFDAYVEAFIEHLDAFAPPPVPDPPQ